MKKYLATIEQTRTLSFGFTEEDIEEGDDQYIAAEELAFLHDGDWDVEMEVIEIQES